MGLASGALSAILAYKDRRLGYCPFASAYLDELPCVPDLVLSDTSSLLYKILRHGDTWEEVFEELQELVSSRAAAGVVAQLYLGDFYPHMPRNKEVEQELRILAASKRKHRDGRTPISPLTTEEINGVSFTEMRGPKPDVDRILMTRGVKMKLLSAFSFRGIMQTDMSCAMSEDAELIVDGIARSIHPLSGDKRPISVCERKTRNNVSEQVQQYQRDIGEGDIRAMWWVAKYWQKWADDDDDDHERKTVLVDFNDSDEVLIFLLNMERFIGSNEHEFDIRIIVRVGGSPWNPYRDGDSSQKAKLIDIGELWKCVHRYVGRVRDTRNCIITFSLLLLLAGTDFVKSINSDGVISSASPFRNLGVSSLLSTFFDNTAARYCLSMAVVNDSYEQIRGNPWTLANTHIKDDMRIVHFIMFAYNSRPRYADCETSTVIEVTKRDQFKQPTMEELRSYEMEIEQQKASSVKRTAKRMSSRKSPRLLTTPESLAVARRAFWVIDYWYNGYLTTGAQECHSKLSTMSNLSRFGWRIDSQTNRVLLASKVCDLREIGMV